MFSNLNSITNKGPCRTQLASTIHQLIASSAAVVATNTYGNLTSLPVDAAGLFGLDMREPSFEIALSLAIAGGVAGTDAVTLRIWDMIPVAGTTEHTCELLGDYVFTAAANAPTVTVGKAIPAAGVWASAATITGALTSSRAPAVKRSEIAGGAKVVVEIPVRGVGLLISYQTPAGKAAYLESRPITTSN